MGGGRERVAWPLTGGAGDAAQRGLAREAMASLGGRLEVARVAVKRWERDFERAHKRAPAGSDLRACAEGVRLHREYRRLKRERDDAAKGDHEGRQGRQGRRKARVLDTPERPKHRTPPRPAARARPADSDSGGSHVSATPIKPRYEADGVVNGPLRASKEAQQALPAPAAARRRRVLAPALGSRGGALLRLGTTVGRAAQQGKQEAEAAARVVPDDVLAEFAPPSDDDGDVGGGAAVGGGGDGAAQQQAPPVALLAMPRPPPGFVASRQASRQTLSTLRSSPSPQPSFEPSSPLMDPPSDVEADWPALAAPAPSRAPVQHSLSRPPSQPRLSRQASSAQIPTVAGAGAAHEQHGRIASGVSAEAAPVAAAAPARPAAQPAPAPAPRQRVTRARVTEATPATVTQTAPATVGGRFSKRPGSLGAKATVVERGSGWDLSSDDEEEVALAKPPARKRGAKRAAAPAEAATAPTVTDKQAVAPAAKRARAAKAAKPAPAHERKNYVRNDFKGHGMKSRLTKLPRGGRSFSGVASKKRWGGGNGLSKAAHRRRFAQQWREDARVLPELEEGSAAATAAAAAAATDGDVLVTPDGLAAPEPAQAAARAAAAAMAEAEAEAAAEAEAVTLEAVARASSGPSDATLTGALSSVMGHAAFRGSQLEVVRRALAGRDCLLVAPTGSGKSVCYQLPAAVAPGITLVVSPLLSLVADQLQSLPPFLKARAAQVSSALSWRQQQAVLARVRAGTLKLLYVAPERLAMPGFRAAVRAAPGGVSLAAVDEAHCVTEWGHSFRPSYARLGKDLREGVGARCVMALTGSATRASAAEVAATLGIASGDVLQACDTVINPATRLRAVRCGNTGVKRQKLLQEMRRSKGATIVYCFMQWECEEVARLLNANGITAIAYHAGMDAGRRKYAQEAWLANRKRAIVATVAFGMGIDRADVRAVMHYSSPKSLENYVQEVGRAGRDGQGATCIAFLDAETLLKQRALSRSHGVDVGAAKALLGEVLATDAGGFGTVNITAKASAKMDVSQAEAEGAVAWLDNGASVLEVLPRSHAIAKLTFHKSEPAQLAEKSELIDTAVNTLKAKRPRGVMRLDVLAAARAMGKSPPEVVEMLQQLQNAGEVGYELLEPVCAFRLTEAAPAADDTGAVDALARRLSRHMLLVQDAGAYRLDGAAAVLSAMAATASLEEGEAAVRAKLSEYFSRERRYQKGGEDEALPLPEGVRASAPGLAGDVRAMVHAVWQDWPERPVRPRAVARILMGVPSAAFKRADWQKRCQWWGRYADVDFGAVLAAAETAVAEVTCLMAAREKAACQKEAAGGASASAGV